MEVTFHRLECRRLALSSFEQTMEVIFSAPNNGRGFFAATAAAAADVVVVVNWGKSRKARRRKGEI